MRICTAEFPDEERFYDAAMDFIARHVADAQPDLLVLPEMPFTPWIFCVDERDPALWEETLEAHQGWLNQLAQSIPTPIVTSRPVNKDGKALNEAIYVDVDRIVHPLREKVYLPNDYPAQEQVWFDEGDRPTGVFDIVGHKVGVQLCSEILYPELPRQLASEGAEVIVQCRATGDHPRWRAAGLLAAATAGAFVIGANRRSTDRDWFTGTGWVYAPNGELLGETSADAPCITVALDMEILAAAKADYPLTMYAHYRAAPS